MPLVPAQDEPRDQAASLRLALIMRRALDRQGLELLIRQSPDIDLVASACGDDDATGLFRSACPDVLLLGGCLPGSATFECTRRVLTAFPEARIIVIDDYPRKARFRAARQSGAIGYWTRDATVAQILAAIRSAARGRATVSPLVRPPRSESPHHLFGDRAIRTDSFAQLTGREMEVFLHLANGLTVKQCAEKMQLSANTVDNHKSRLMKKLGVHRSVDLARLAIREGLLA